MIQVVIPSYKRAGKVTALNSFPSGYEPHLIVREEEADEYRKHYGNKAKIVPITGAYDIASTRRIITELYAGKKILMIDDDTTIHCGVEDEKYRRAAPEYIDDKIYDLFQMIETAMEKGFVHGHICFPIFPVGAGSPNFAENSYGFTNVWLDLTQITADDVGYGLVEICEDAYSYLRLIKMGYNALKITKYLVKSGKGNAEGGCSEFRTAENHNRSLEKLVEDFPEYVKWKNKKSGLALKGEEEVKVVTIRAGKRQKSAAFHEMLQLYPAN
ncbi:hypothetical protein ACX818_001375 [Acinetobacter baumannii]